MTNGYGVDVVINSLVGEGLRASWECIAPYGRFIEIGKTDINTNSSLPMLPFAKNAMFASVDIRHLLLNRKQVALELLHKTMTMMDEGTIHYPKPLNIYAVGSVEDAFRYIQSGKNSGRVVIHIDPAIEVQKCLITRRDWKFASDASYLVVGGFGGVGRSILRWMVSKGATNLIIPTRSAVLSAAAVDIMEEFRGQGITITTVECDVASRDMLARALEDWRQTLPPIRGCINAAMVLNDAVYENMSCAQWNGTIQSKVSTSWNLHSLVSDMDWMVLLSSVSGIVGNPGQANYAAGCTFQDSLARYRTEHGQKTISIDLGVMRSIGVVAESEILQNHFGEGSRGLGQIEEQELLALLDIICDPAIDKTLTRADQIVMGLGTPVDFLTQSLEVPEIMERPLFAHFSQTTSSEQTDSDNAAGDNLTRMFRQAATAEERAKIAAQSLAGKLARALAIEAPDVDVGKPLHAFGVDSLVAVELRNWIAKEFSADVPVFEIMGGRTVEGIGELIEKSSQFGRGT
ncbi:polyketide synthase [Pestalotiopsis sp. 9143b]|nr:polyketide synthase [Pestalotiopsis sp. 9143b]